MVACYWSSYRSVSRRAEPVLAHENTAVLRIDRRGPDTCCLTFCGHDHPAELCFDDECFSTRYFTYPQHFCIGYLILPCDFSYATQTTHVERIKTAYMTSTGDLRLAAIQQGGDNYSFIDCNFCAQAHTAFLPEAGFQSAECCASNTCAPSDVVIDLRIL